MKLEWKFDIPRNKLWCSVEDNLTYTAYSGGKDGIMKSCIGYNDILISYDDWPAEMRWISDNYLDKVGELEIPPELTNEEGEEFMEVTGCPVFPSWGFSKPYTKDNYEVYDRLARPGWLMQNRDGKIMSEIARFEGKGIFETDGTNIYKRGWNKNEETYYNVMPCCLFPNNPGWSLSSIEELQEAGYDGEPNLEPGTEPELLEKHFVLP